MACPKFAPLVESGALSTSVTKKVVYETLRPLVGKVDSLILGCTHYPLLRSLLKELVGDQVTLVNPAYETALELKKLLSQENLLSTGRGQEEFPYRFYVSDLAEKFRKFADSILPYDVEKTKKIDIEKY